MKRDSLLIWKNFLRKYWKTYTLGLLAVIVSDVTQVLATRLLGWIIDIFNKKPVPFFLGKFTNKELFFLFLLFLFLVKVFQMVGRFGWRITLGRSTFRAGALLKKKVWGSARYFPRKDLDQELSKGELMNAANSDVNTGRFIFGFTLMAIFDLCFLGLFTLIAMFAINVELTLLALAVLLFIPFAVKKLSDQEVIRYRLAQESLTSFNDLVSQVISSIRLQRVTQTGGFWQGRLIDSAEDYRAKKIKAVNTSLNYIPTMGGGAVLSLIILFFLGMNMVFSGKISVGDFVAMQGLVLIIQEPLMELGYIISDWKKALTSLERLSDIYLRPQDLSLIKEGAVVRDESDEVLDLKKINFFYQKDLAIFKNFSLKIKKGNRLGITGPIGTGKTTLLNILAGLERNVSGTVNFLDNDFSHYSHEELRKYIVLIPQKPFLFADTIYENISLGKKMDRDEVWRFLELAGLDGDVKGFSDGLDTALGEWGINLSGGQKQRLTIARALAHKPKLLLLDDCLSAVDTVTEERILENLNNELKDSTIVWVAHRKSTLKYCDRVIELTSSSERLSGHLSEGGLSGE